MEELAELNRKFEALVPYNRALGFELVSMERGRAVMRLPYRSDLVGHADSGVLHGGPITAMMDASAGSAVFMRLRKPVPIATLDLRVDYMTSATPGLDLFAEAECYRLTRNVAFVRGTAYHESPGEPIAALAASFIVGTTTRHK